MNYTLVPIYPKMQNYIGREEATLSLHPIKMHIYTTIN